MKFWGKLGHSKYTLTILIEQEHEDFVSRILTYGPILLTLYSLRQVPRILTITHKHNEPTLKYLCSDSKAWQGILENVEQSCY